MVGYPVCGLIIRYLQMSLNVIPAEGGDGIHWFGKRVKMIFFEKNR